MAVVTPWEVKGDIDYTKLVKEFGITPFRTIPRAFKDALLFRRGVVYAHREFSRITNAIDKKEPFVMMTGLMPSGKFHLGHKVVAEQIKMFQDAGAHVYIAVADVEAYTARGVPLTELRNIALMEYLANYIALGIDMKRTTFYFQSARSNNAKEANAYYRLASLLARHGTFNEFRGVYGEITPGKMTAALLQAADMYHPQLPEFLGKPLPTVIPVGVDQDPHLRLARGLAKRLPGHTFTPLSATYNTFLPGLKGGKMSSSDPMSYVALDEEPEAVAKKIRKYAFSGGQSSVALHREKGGNPDVDVAFQMLRFGLEPDDETLRDLETRYRSGALLTGELKQHCIERMTAFLEQHQPRLQRARDTLATKNPYA